MQRLIQVFSIEIEDLWKGNFNDEIKVVSYQSIHSIIFKSASFSILIYPLHDSTDSCYMVTRPQDNSETSLLVLMNNIFSTHA